MIGLGWTGLVAVRREGLPLRRVMHEEGWQWQGEARLQLGRIGSQPVALAEVLPGPVNAALGAQALIIHHGVSRLISFGSAGALDAVLSPGDRVIGQRAVSHDAGVFLGQGFEPSGIMGRDGRGQAGYRRAFEAAPELVARALQVAADLEGRTHTGTIVTGNQVVFSTTRRRWLRQTFDALAVDMEAAAVAQVAVAYGLPWVAIRAISDTADDRWILDYKRLRRHIDDGSPAWRYRVQRWLYLLSHPLALRRLSRLRRGLRLASARASQLVAAMFLAATGPGLRRIDSGHRGERG
jgi:adenosylhomocysteine nucleosidase